MIEEFHNIPFLSPLWGISNSLLIFSMILGLYFSKKANPKNRKRIEIGMLIFLLIILLGWQFYYINTGTWDAGKSLPLHLCSISRILVVILLFRFNQLIFEFCALIGLGGVLQSLMTPAINVNYNWLTHTEYFVSHGFIYFVVFYLIYIKGHRISKGAWWKAYLFGNAVMLAVGIINYFIEGNYWYICIKPGADNPLLIGPWPYYISGFLVFGLINSLVFYWIFRTWGKRLDKNLENN